MPHEDAEELREVLNAVSETVPKLLNDITDALFSPEKTAAFGKSVAEFYQSLVSSGMSPDQAFELTKKFMDSSSPGGMITQALGGIGGHGDKNIVIHGHGHGDFGNDIEKRVKEKMKEKFGDNEE